ncbi:hypothetical protein A6411_05800 [Prescottella equi]|nr:hypothetical protein A6411_05800 [Prescottella equi]
MSSVANVLGIAGHEEDSIATFKCRVVVGDAIDFPAGSRIRCTTPDRTLVFHVGLRSFAPSGPR